LQHNLPDGQAYRQRIVFFSGTEQQDSKWHCTICLQLHLHVV